MAKMDQPILKYIIVGNVFIVDVKINAKLDANANTNSHQNCFPNRRPGNIINNFVEKAKNSIVFTLFQYDFSKSLLVITITSLVFIIIYLFF